MKIVERFNSLSGRAIQKEATERLGPLVRPKRLHKAPLGECACCDRERQASNMFHPFHDASEQCESGKHSHCSCDTCF